MELQLAMSENTLSLSRVSITPSQRAKIEKIHADFLAKMEKWRRELVEKRMKF